MFLILSLLVVFSGDLWAAEPTKVVMDVISNSTVIEDDGSGNKILILSEKSGMDSQLGVVYMHEDLDYKVINTKLIITEFKMIPRKDRANLIKGLAEFKPNQSFWVDQYTECKLVESYEFEPRINRLRVSQKFDYVTRIPKKQSN